MLTAAQIAWRASRGMYEEDHLAAVIQNLVDNSVRKAAELAGLDPDEVLAAIPLVELASDDRPLGPDHIVYRGE